MAKRWYYKPGGEAQIFEAGTQPKNEGWKDTPGPEHYPNYRPELHHKNPINPAVPLGPDGAVAVPGPGPNQELTDEEKLGQMKRAQLMTIAAEVGIKFDMTWTKDQLKGAIIAAMKDE